MWMKFVDYLSLKLCPRMLSRRRSSLELWRERHCHGLGYVMIWDHGTTTDWNWNFIRSFILCILFIVIAIIYIIFGLAKEKASLKLGGGLSQCYIHAPIMSSQEKWLFKIFRLSDNNRTMLDTSCAGSFMMKTIEFKWDLLERIKRNSEDWDLDEGKGVRYNT